MRRLNALIWNALWIAQILPSISLADTAPKAGFSLSHEVHQLKLQRCGVATLKAYGIFTVGQSALYRQTCHATWSASDIEPIHMVFQYNRAIPAKAFRESAMEIMQRNIKLNSEEIGTLNQFHQAYQPVEAGDTYSITYFPETGLQLQLNGNLLATLKDQELAREYFNIWLGEDPFDDRLKRQLMHSE
ncbi:chalcone isomerase family protein [Hahella ganghwensis]|uniref:chalcone isomerase family protein n=1 Tax=Hahella ganghwensis TaxID=286420 RepID=UPI000371DD13|nr:chalcone isomerase family protein [Hahella ganghwensis]